MNPIFRDPESIREVILRAITSDQLHELARYLEGAQIGFVRHSFTEGSLRSQINHVLDYCIARLPFTVWGENITNPVGLYAFIANFIGLRMELNSDPGDLGTKKIDAGPLILKRLRLKNWRSVGDLEIDFEPGAKDGKVRQWTLLLGENGTGKSNILRAIALILAGRDSLLKLVQDVDGWIQTGAATATIEADVGDRMTEKESTISLTFSRGIDLAVFARRHQDIDALAWLDEGLREKPKNHFLVAYGASRRFASGLGRNSSGVDDFLTPRAQALATLFHPGADLYSIRDWAIDLDYRSESEGLRQIYGALENLLPGVRFSHIDKQYRELMFHTPDGTVPLSRLSDGFQNVVSWLGDLLYHITATFPEVESLLEAPGILLLDEMDLHLHPVWQKKLIGFLTQKLPNFQIIATTHSPITALQAGPHELHLLERSGGHGAPRIRRFEGTPRHMRLQDLAISPWFGLDSQYSEEVQERRKKQPKSSSKVRVTDVHQTVRGMASEAVETDEEIESALHLADPDTALEKQNNAILRRLESIVAKEEPGGRSEGGARR